MIKISCQTPFYFCNYPIAIVFTMLCCFFFKMQNARSKIHDIFMVYSSKQQMELIARSRRAAIDRQKKLSQKVSDTETGKGNN